MTTADRYDRACLLAKRIMRHVMRDPRAYEYTASDALRAAYDLMDRNAEVAS